MITQKSSLFLRPISQLVGSIHSATHQIGSFVKANRFCLSVKHYCSTTDKPHVAGMRKPYKNKQDVFDVKDLASKEPFQQFSAWFEEAKSTPGIFEANAMALATASSDGKPSVRMVLMKGLCKDGIDFYTNYHSRKSQELMENPHCSLMFYWEALNKSVLDKRNDDLHSQYGDESITIPKPDYWGGFRVTPERYEFWQGQSNRIHDRILFRKPQEGETIVPSVTFEGSEGWVYERLQP